MGIEPLFKFPSNKIPSFPVTCKSALGDAVPIPTLSVLVLNLTTLPSSVQPPALPAVPSAEPFQYSEPLKLYSLFVKGPIVDKAGIVIEPVVPSLFISRRIVVPSLIVTLSPVDVVPFIPFVDREFCF